MQNENKLEEFWYKMRYQQDAYKVADQHADPVLLLSKILEHYGEFQSDFDLIGRTPITPMERMTARGNAKLDCWQKIRALLEHEFEHDVERVDA